MSVTPEAVEELQAELARLRPIAEAALAQVRAEHQISRDLETVRAAQAAQEALVAVACAADPEVAAVVAVARARRAALEREHEHRLRELWARMREG